MLTLLWRRFTVRHWLHAPGASLSLVLILALGVAVFYSVRLANRSAVAGFAQFSSTLTGDADLVVTSDAGRLHVEELIALRRQLGTRPVFLVPMLEATASLPGSGKADDDFDARQVQVIGIDLVSIQNLHYARNGMSMPAIELVSPVGTSGTGLEGDLFLTAPLAESLKAEAGGVVEVFLGDQLRLLRVGAILETEGIAVNLPRDLMVMDLPALQRLTGRTGWVNRVELFLPASADIGETLADVEAVLGPGIDRGWMVESGRERKMAASEMTAAFRANLTILSGLALLVGVYLIVQALEAAVVRRRPEIATLLSLGTEPRTIRAAWFLEAGTFGAVGTVLGLGLGYAGAQLAVQGVAQTVNALYVSTEATRASWHTGEAVLASCIGMGASLVSGILPARDAAQTPPAHVLRQGAHSPSIKLLDRPWQGALLVLLGLGLVQLPPVEWSGKARFPLGGYAGAVCWLVGVSVLVGALFPWAARMLHAAGRRSAAIRVALSQFRQPSGRHKLTAAGLVVAVSMAAGMGILIHSFEETMENWIERTLKADLFVACKGVQNASNRNRISEATWVRMKADPAIAAVDVGHIHAIRIEGAPTFLVGPRLGRGWDHERLIWLTRRDGPVGLDRPDADGAWPAYISESFGQRFQKALGDQVRIPTPAGEKDVRVAGIFADYGNERGSILIDPDRVTGWFRDTTAVNVAAYLAPGAALEDVRQRWSTAFPALAVRANATLRAEVLRIFRQTFSITYALKVIGVTVAVAGLVLSLVSLLLERRRELATLKEVGMSAGQLRWCVMTEGGVMACIGLLGGIALSVALGYVLIFVINRQSFGWTLGFSIPWGQLVGLAGLVLAASLLSAAVVGRWASRLQGEQEE